jgi:hypothetical protein
MNNLSMKEFQLHGPYYVSFDKKGNHKQINPTNFWESVNNGELENGSGIYVFAVKGSGGNRYIPYYVGKTKRCFRDESFTRDKLLKYERALNSYSRAHPYIFFIVHPKGKKNKSILSEIEEFLIQTGYEINSEIQNEKDIYDSRWKIKGILYDSKKSSNDEKIFKKMFGF